MTARPPPTAVAVIAAVAAQLAATPATASQGAWGEGTKASVRLVAAGVDADGYLDAGLEIALPAGWHTYWRAPGDAGIPPSFDFSASANLADVVVDFPVPVQLDDGATLTNVYYDRVLLPVRARVIDPAGPSSLSVTLDLGVCDEICVPDAATATVAIAPGVHDAAARAQIDAARAALPSPAEPGVFAVTAVARDGGTDKRPVFRFDAVVPDPADAVFLVEGPPHWSPYRPEKVADGEGTAWTVKFSRLGADVAADDATFRVTMISGGRAVEQTIAPR